MENTDRYQQTRKATLIGALANVVLSTLKIIFGWLGNSHALIADGIHSFSDLLTDLLVILAAKFANQAADTEHPYGHERIETAATVALSLFLVFVGVAIIYDAGDHLWRRIPAPTPSSWVLWIALFSIILNEVIYRYTLHVAKKINSDILKANALHSRSDAAASLVVLVGIIGSLLGYHYLDALAAVVVGGFIIKMGIGLGWSNLRELVDTGVDEKTLSNIKKSITGVQGVVDIHLLRTRKMAGRILIDVHIIVQPTITVSEGHHIGDKVLSALYKDIANIQDITIHIDSEDDATYSQSAFLPSRHELLPKLQCCWQGLPGADVISHVHLHYLAGSISVEVVLPLLILDRHMNAESLTQLYQAKLHDLPEISMVKLMFN
jgi:cation diffusion facilitator family transporter